jgi:phenylpyruvate tautomerase PptA (4-oxalocrotonate tautomerase family)
MPFVRITLRKGKSPEFLRSVGDAIHDALVAQANVPADDRFHVFDEVESDRLIAHPSYGGVDRSDGLVVVEITLNAGRTVEIKRALYADIAARLQAAAGVRPDDVLINLVEVTKENWSFGKGLATYAPE